MLNKKFLVYLSTALLLVIILLFFLFKGQDNTIPTILNVDKEEEIDLFYYRSVPGLKRAQQLDLVTPVNKGVDLPGYNARLNIDYIWYNNRDAIIFYHVKDLDIPAFLGGNIYLPSHEPISKTPFWGMRSIGRNNEKGILYKGSFYSCLRLPRIKNSSDDAVDTISKIILKPFLNIYNPTGSKNGEELEVLSLRPVEIQLDYDFDNETVIKLPLEYQIQFDEKRINLYQTDISPSGNRIYFQFLNSGRDMVYRIKGNIKTDKGENYNFDEISSVITGFPYHYYFEFPPFHKIPGEVHLFIESMELIGSDRLTFNIDTSHYQKSKSYKVDKTIDSIKNTSIGIDTIAIKSDHVSISLLFNPSTKISKPSTRLNPNIPVSHSTASFIGNITKEIYRPANTIMIQNDEYQKYDFSVMPYGFEVKPGDELIIKLSRDYWDISKKISIEIGSLSYIYELDRNISIKIDTEL